MSNSFLVNSCAPLANLYNDQSVLEHHHASYTFRLLHRQTFDFAKSMHHTEKDLLRLVVIEMILATDLETHFNQLTHFNLRAENEHFPQNQEDRLLMLKIILHASDISRGATRGNKLYLEWTRRIVTEFFIKGELEKRNNLTVTMFHDRCTTNVAKMQIGFIDIFVMPLFAALEPFAGDVVSEQLIRIEDNRDFWVTNRDRNDSKSGLASLNVFWEFWQNVQSVDCFLDCFLKLSRFAAHLQPA